MSGGGGYRDSIPIPKTAKKIIKDIREITRKQHSDEEIYAVLMDCSMDPNETAQKLLFLDTFHEVKKRRNRRKECISSSCRTSQDSVSIGGTQGRGVRGRRVNNPHRTSSEAGGGRNNGGQRENALYKSKERGSVLYLMQDSQKTKRNATPSVTRAFPVMPSGPMSLPNGSSRHQGALKSHKDVAEDEPANVKELHFVPSVIAAAASPSSTLTPAPTFSSVVRAEHRKSKPNSDGDQTASAPVSLSGLNITSDPVLVKPCSPQKPGVAGFIKCEVGSQQEPGEAVHCEIISQNTGNSDLLKNATVASEIEIPVHQKASEEPTATQDQLSKSLQPSSTSVGSTTVHDTGASQEIVSPKGVVSITVEANSQLLPELGVPDDHHVTFPSHMRVPEAFKNGLTFGSFTASFGLEIKAANVPASNNSSATVALSEEGDEMSNGSSSNSSVSANDQGRDHPNHLHPPQVMREEVPSTEMNGLSDVPSTEDNVPLGVISHYDQSKQETLLPSDAPQDLTLQDTSNYTLGLVPPERGSQLAQRDGTETQAQDASSLQNVDAKSSVLTTPSPTPPLAQPGIMQGSIAMPPPLPVPLFRQPYPPNYFPYGHYIPLVVPQAQQYLSPNVLPHQPSTGNLYVPPQAAGAGIKFPSLQFKPGTAAGNQTPGGIPSGYSSYSSSPVGYSVGPPVTLGTSTGNKDFALSQLKENHPYSAGQLNEGSAAWIPRPGQDIASLPHNSLYNMLPQGQHLNYSPSLAGHSPYTGIFQPAQTMTAPNMQTLLRQSQARAGAIEAVAPESGVYQQAQHAQMWGATNM